MEIQQERQHAMLVKIETEKEYQVLLYAGTHIPSKKFMGGIDGRYKVTILNEFDYDSLKVICEPWPMRLK